MNKTFRTVWNAALGAWVAAPETVRTGCQGAAGSARGGRAQAVLGGRGPAVARLTPLALAVALLAAVGTPAPVLAQPEVKKSGDVTGNGSGSAWDLGIENLYVGNSGDGTLLILSGGSVKSKSGYIGNYDTAVGHVTVTGNDSKWAADGQVRVGASGNGTLVISDGAVVTSLSGSVATDTGSRGSATVTGQGSAWTSTNILYVGDGGNGTLVISDGGAVDSSHGYVGRYADAVGTVTVAGTRSKWTVDSGILLGAGGTGSNGTLAISLGGLVNTRLARMTLAGSQGSQGTLDLLGSATQPRGVLQTAQVIKGQGTVTLNLNGGILRATEYQSDYLRGFSALALGANGVVFDTNGFHIGVATSFSSTATTGEFIKLGTGMLTLDGTSEIAGRVIVDGGTLSLEPGKQLRSREGSIGLSSSTTATVSVTGRGTTLSTQAAQYVGESGNGTLAISAGGQVLSGTAALGRNSNAVGTATVQGIDSQWTNSDSLIVGESGKGNLAISDGGQMLSATAVLGRNLNSVGTVTVKGIESKWTNSDSLVVGELGEGTLALSEGAQVSASSISLARTSGAQGTLNLLGNTSQGRGVLQTSQVIKGQGTATLNLDGGVLRAMANQTNYLSGFTAAALGANGVVIDTNGYDIGVGTALSSATIALEGLVKQGTGTLALSGASSHTSGTVVDAGTMAITGAGSLSSTGALNLRNTGAASGNAPATFDISSAANPQNIGSLTGTADSRLVLGSSRLAVGAGNLSTTFAGTLSGTATANFTQQGSGTLTLTGNSSGFVGNTSVLSGALAINGALGGNVAVNNGAILGGAGIVGGNVQVLSGGTLSPSNSPGTLRINGDLTLNPGASTRLELGQAGVAGGAGNDFIRVGGNLTLGGALDATVASAGWYQLMDYGGSLSGSFATKTLSSSTAFMLDRSRVDTGSAGQVNLAVLGAGQNGQRWNGGSGTSTNVWDSSSLNWNAYDAPHTPDSWQLSVATFGSDAGMDSVTPGTVSVVGQQSFDTLQFAADGYTLAAGSGSNGLRINPASGNSGFINTGRGLNATVSAPITDGAGTQLTLTGGGTLTLSGDNRYTGGTVIDSGTLVAGSNMALGTGEASVQGSASILRIGSGIRLANAISASQGGTVDNAGILNQSSNLAHGVVGGAGGAVVRNSAGGSITGTDIAVRLNAGGSVTNTGGSTASLLSGGNTGVLVEGASGSVTNSGGASISGGGVGVLLQAGGRVDNEAGSNITGTLSVQGNGSQAVSLTNAGRLTGAVQLDSSAANHVTLHSGGTLTGHLDIGTHSGSTLTLDGTGLQNYSDAVSGDTILSGALVKTGSGTWNIDKAPGSGFAPTSATLAQGTLALSGAAQLGSATALSLTGSDAVFDISAASGTQQVGTLSGVAGSRIELGARTLRIGNAAAQRFAGEIHGTGGLEKIGSGTHTLMAASSHSGGTALKEGRLDVGNSLALGTGELAMDDGTTLGFAADGLAIANTIRMTGSNDPVIDTGSFNGTLTGVISGAGFLTKEGSGTLTVTAANNYTGPTFVNAGTLKAGAAHSFSPASAITIASGAALDSAGLAQTVAGIQLAGTVSLKGSAPGSTLTVTGPWVGQGGTLAILTALGDSSSATDKVLLSGSAAVATGSTQVAVTNAGGLGAQTTGDGIEIVGTANGASIQGEVFRLAAPVAAGAYDYQLHNTASGAYLSSQAHGGGGTDAETTSYRVEAPLLSGLPEQLRQANLGMLGSLHQRIGDAGGDSAQGGQRQAWGRLLSVDRNIRQAGTVSPHSEGRLTGFQAGTDLWANAHWRTGLYVGQLEGDMQVHGFARGIAHYASGRNRLLNQYLAGYATWRDDAGLYVDGVIQAGRHRSDVQGQNAIGTQSKGSSQLASVEVGKAVTIASLRIEPQLQLVHQRISLDDASITGLTTVHQDAKSTWTVRAGVRIQGDIATSAGALQPYARLNLWHQGGGTDRTRFRTLVAITDLSARTGGTSTELAVGGSLQVSPGVRVYGELGQMWASAGSAKTQGGPNASFGVKVRW